MDTVWITLNKVTAEEKGGKYLLTPKTFMFGPTGVISFERDGQFTVLNSNTRQELVDCEPEQIMHLIGKIRKTQVKTKANVKSKKRKT
jgi:hypothetical protein